MSFCIGIDRKWILVKILRTEPVFFDKDLFMFVSARWVLIIFDYLSFPKLFTELWLRVQYFHDKKKNDVFYSQLNYQICPFKCSLKVIHNTYFLIYEYYPNFVCIIVDNTAKGRISKRVFQGKFDVLYFLETPFLPYYISSCEQSSGKAMTKSFYLRNTMEL